MIKFEIYKTSPLPVHTQLIDELRHKVLTGILKPHDQLPSEWELANELDISRTTIQKAWQSAEEENLIYRVPGKGTFIAESHPSSSVRWTVGLIIPDFRSTSAGSLLHGAERVLRQHGYRVEVAVSEYPIEEENRILTQMRRDGIRGYIIWPVKDGDDRLLSQLSTATPIVLLDRPVPGLHVPYVTSNNYAGGLQAMEHLIRAKC